MRAAALVVAAALAACGDNSVGAITIVAPPDLVDPIGGLVALTGDGSIAVRGAADPAAEAVADRDLRIAVVVDLTCTECYRIDPAGDDAWIVHAGDRLGAQYGAAHALENLGYRFRSPFASYAPTVPRFDPAAAASLGVEHAPQIRVRGFHIHTLHPIEGHFALWQPGPEGLAEAERIFHWVIANRGNYIQWVGLDDIMEPERHAAWRDYTAQLIERAHALGLRVGFNMQLFGQSNLQRAFDLSDDRTGMVPLAEELAARLPLIIDGVPFDVYDLSFGEFFGADPDEFVNAVNAVSDELRARAPAAEMHALIHVGADQRVTYQGQDVIFYFLVQFARPRIIPDIHTVMYYDLYEDAGGAYHHDDFAEHRQYLLDRIAAGEPAAYHPETAYWVAFDNSVPVYVPLYVRSRWLDLDRLASDPAAMGGALDEHLIFSSGWEWGYWLHDYTALRASYSRPAAYRDLIVDAFGADLGSAVDPVVELIELQHAALLEGRLAAYLAGRDIAIDTGRELGIVSQPDRVLFSDLSAADPATRDAFAADVLTRLDALAAALADLDDRVADLGLGGEWGDELRDGFAITALRARFVATAYHAVLAQLAGDIPAATAAHDELLDLMNRATAVVRERRDHLHAPRGSMLVERTGNSTFYAYGYLYMADTLCFWTRELRQVEAVMGIQSDPPSDCLL